MTKKLDATKKLAIVLSVCYWQPKFPFCKRQIVFAALKVRFKILLSNFCNRIGVMSAESWAVFKRLLSNNNFSEALTLNSAEFRRLKTAFAKRDDKMNFQECNSAAKRLPVTVGARHNCQWMRTENFRKDKLFSWLKNLMLLKSWQLCLAFVTGSRNFHSVNVR